MGGQDIPSLLAMQTDAPRGGMQQGDPRKLSDLDQLFMIHRPWHGPEGGLDGSAQWISKPSDEERLAQACLNSCNAILCLPCHILACLLCCK
jgi:hypothetical protein